LSWRNWLAIQQNSRDQDLSVANVGKQYLLRVWKN